jgi:RNA polymerase sigma-70 factor, ECF subfamily
VPRTSAVDEELMCRVALGNHLAFSEIYDRYRRPLYYAGMRYLGDSFLAEDLVQDVFTNVLRRASSFDPGRGNFSSWLYRIARNRAVDLIRHRNTLSSVGEEPLLWVAGGQEPEASVDGLDVAGALSRLPDKQRTLLVLAYFEGLSQSEISRRTGVPLGTVKTRTTAGLKKLRRILPNPTTEGI